MQGKILALVFFCVLVALSTCSDNAPAHDAPKGWSYPVSCCSGIDCREANTKASAVRVTEKDGGWLISSTGEWIADTDKKIKPSPDGEFHWCSVDGKADTETICLFVPPRAY